VANRSEPIKPQIINQVFEPHFSAKEGKIKTMETMEALEQKLAGSSFFRCHRGFIINLNMIKEIKSWGRKTVRNK